MFDQMKELMKLKKQADEMKKKLKNIHIESEAEGVNITLDAEFEIISVSISDEAWSRGKDAVEKGVFQAFKKGIKKAQEVAAHNMKDIMGDMGTLGKLGQLGK